MCAIRGPSLRTAGTSRRALGDAPDIELAIEYVAVALRLPLALVSFYRGFRARRTNRRRGSSSGAPMVLRRSIAAPKPATAPHRKTSSGEALKLLRPLE